MSKVRRSLLSLACVAGALAGGCAGVGPPTVARDRFDYVSTISESWKRQMLHNLLKVRYADAPVFLDVATIINSYTLEAEANVLGQHAPPGRGDTFLGAGVTGRYTDRPTITYSPLSGERFARSLVSPLPTTSVLYLIQSGYSADIVLRLCVNSINGLDNAFGGSGNQRPGEPRFAELLAAMREAQRVGDLGFRVKTQKDADAVMIFRPIDAGAQSARVRELLGIRSKATEFRVVFGNFAVDDTEIAILTRSMLQVLVEMASYIEVPELDASQGRVYQPTRTAEQERLFSPLLRVRNGAEAPADAYVSVRYRDRWFWIDDRDVASKTTLTFVMLMFSLTETGGTQAGAPVVTVPAR